ncbi:hypothetical protein NMQ03_08825 [Arthrobacter sp. DNA4]|uniref:hypothetical protein n=1 Tax=Arthrobacter sp. DNA4 TaxID=2963432 RepID=UPI0020CF0BB0|nr:hypothetical protein [Arthrobacter sp. DNA4]UTT71159.1 hypothetical protein NMQ03_08825 [Arthrobacter sp. DNA4]
MTALFAVGAGGVAVLVVSVLLGALLGFFDNGDGLISSASIGAALTFFGPAWWPPRFAWQACRFGTSAPTPLRGLGRAGIVEPPDWV